MPARLPPLPHSTLNPFPPPPPFRRSFAEGQSGVRFLDCGPRFLTAGGTQIDAALMPDALHPGKAGHERGLAQCIKPVVDELMQG